jgi:hypothetical protein
VLARFAEPQQLKAIKDGLTLDEIDHDGLYLAYRPLWPYFVSGSKGLIKSIFS